MSKQIHFAKMYDPIKRKVQEEDQETPKFETLTNEEPWTDEDDRVANFYITTNPEYNKKKLPNIIKISNTKDGEVAIYIKRSFPKAARIHKKNENNDPHRFFLSELMLYTAYTDEEQLGANDEEKCLELYLRKEEAIQFVKSYMMPYAQGVEEARYRVEEAMKEGTTSSKNIGNELDPEQEKEIVECEDGDDQMHPDFVQVNPDDFDFESNLNQVKRTLRRLEIKTAEQILQEARNLDKFQKKALHIAVKFAQDVLIARKGTLPYPKAPLLLVHGGAGSG